PRSPGLRPGRVQRTRQAGTRRHLHHEAPIALPGSSIRLLEGTVCNGDYYLFLTVAGEGGTFMSQRNIAVPTEAQEEACPINEVLDHIAGKWIIGIIVAAAAGPIRFTELERAIEGISRRMLALNLRKLDGEGLLIRPVYRTVPHKVEYSLS